MFNSFTVSRRIHLVIGLLAVFLLVLGTNRIDVHHFDTAQNALTSVYNDRVLAQDYVYKMNNQVHEQQLAFTSGTPTDEVSNSCKELRTLMDLFSTTELTRNETKVFKRMEKSFDKISKHEKSYFKNTRPSNYDAKHDFTPILTDLNEFQTELNNLALIQVSESKNILEMGQKSLDTNRLLSNLEIWFLLVIGIVVQFLIFPRSAKTKE
jgi:hypothetical protein